MNSIKLSFAAFVVVATFSGCGGGSTLTPAQMQEVNQFDVSKIDTFAEELHKGMNDDELIFYAPYNIDLAKEYYKDALEAEKKDEKMAAYLKAKKALDDAYESKKMVKKYLADVADIDRRMQIQNTKEIFAGRYENFKDDYNDLIVLIDKRQTPEALEEKKTVMQEAKDLYGDAVVYRNINRAKIILENMEDEDLDELAPMHFEKAQQLYESSRLRIKKEPDNKEMVQRVSKQTNEAAQYAQTLAKDVFYFRELNEDEHESYFAKLHRRLSQLNPNEQTKAILPLSIYEKIDYLQEVDKPTQYIAPQTLVPVETSEVIMEVEERPKTSLPKELPEEVNETIQENNTTVPEVVNLEETFPKEPATQEEVVVVPEKAMTKEEPAAEQKKENPEVLEDTPKTLNEEIPEVQEALQNTSEEIKEQVKEDVAKETQAVVEVPVEQEAQTVEAETPTQTKEVSSEAEPIQQTQETTSTSEVEAVVPEAEATPTTEAEVEEVQAPLETPAQTPQN